MWRDSFIRVSWLIVVLMWLLPSCDMTHSRVWHDSHVCKDKVLRTRCVTWLTSVCVTWLTSVCVTRLAWHDIHSYTRVTWLTSVCVTWSIPVYDVTHSSLAWRMPVCDVTHPCVWHDSFQCAAWLIHMFGVTQTWEKKNPEDKMCDVTYFCVCDMDHFGVWHFCVCVTWLSVRHDYSCVWRDSFMCDVIVCATWIISACDMTHFCVGVPLACVWHDSFMCVTWLIHVCDMTHSCVWRDSFMCVTGLILCWYNWFQCVAWLVRVRVFAMNNTCETTWYGVATISRLLKIIGLFCKRAL